MEEEKLRVSSRESTAVMCLQMLLSGLLAGLGTVTAGLLLDRLQVSDSLVFDHTESVTLGWMTSRSSPNSFPCILYSKSPYHITDQYD